MRIEGFIIFNIDRSRFYYVEYGVGDHDCTSLIKNYYYGKLKKLVKIIIYKFFKL